LIPVAEPWIGEKELQYVTDCVKSGWISSLGDYVIAFEERFARYCGMEYGISCANGTVALHLALVALGIGGGDEVICPTLTFIATANAISYTGAKPVFVDSEPYTWNIDPERIEEKMTKNTKAIIPVHLYGHPCDMDRILEIARANGLYVIEDAAEAHGAKYKGKMVGSMGDIACFSFYGNKIITTGEGGMLLTNDEDIFERAKLLRDHAMSTTKRYWHEFIGFNYRFTNVQAAIGLAQLERIDEIIKIKRKNAKLYNSLLKDVEGLTLPPEMDWAENVFWMYSVLIEDDFPVVRDELADSLRERGIDTRPFFCPIHVQPAYSEYNSERFPVAEELARKGINLPSGTTLMREDIQNVVSGILSCIS